MTFLSFLVFSSSNIILREKNEKWSILPRKLSDFSVSDTSDGLIIFHLRRLQYFYNKYCQSGHRTILSSNSAIINEYDRKTLQYVGCFPFFLQNMRECVILTFVYMVWEVWVILCNVL